MITENDITKELDRIILIINSKETWDNDTKIRYAYIELGKIIHKNVMFFYTMQNNLKGVDKESIRLKSTDISDIMNSNDYTDSVICKTSANMLKYIFDNTNIESRIMETTKSDVFSDEYGSTQISHFFICATGNDDNKYFLTLNADLPNIQAGFETKHFANNIAYINIVEEDGIKKEEITYKGAEIHNTVLSLEQIATLDKKIGYLNSYFSDNDTLSYNDLVYEMLYKEYYNKNNYQAMLGRETPEYFDIVKLLNGEASFEDILVNPSNKYLDNSDVFLHANLKEISDDRWNDIKKYIVIKTIDKFILEYDVNISVNELLAASKMIDNFEFDNAIGMLRQNEDLILKFKYQKNDLNPLAVLSKLNGFLKTIDKLRSSINSNINKEEQNKILREFSNNLFKTCSFFTNRYYFVNSDEIVTNSEYVAHKIEVFLNTALDYNSNQPNAFDYMGIGEKTVLIKDLLQNIFRDIKVSAPYVNYNDKKSPLLNRVVTSVMINKQTNEYAYLIYVKPIVFSNSRLYPQYGGIPILIDFKSRKLHMDVSLVDIINSYYIINDKELKIDIENIESNSRKR